jgi:hypothetical protein
LEEGGEELFLFSWLRLVKQQIVEGRRKGTYY